MLSQDLAGPVPPHLINPRVPVALSETILRAMARRPEERFARALDFRHAMLDAAQGQARSRPKRENPESAPRGHTPVPMPTVSLRAPRAHVPPRPQAMPAHGWTARVHRRNGVDEVEVRCTELSRGGLFMCCAQPFPRLFTRLTFTLLLDGEPVECVGEVVRHVDPEQARTWGMPQGIGLQFVNPFAPAARLPAPAEPQSPRRHPGSRRRGAGLPPALTWVSPAVSLQVKSPLLNARRTLCGGLCKRAASHR